MQYTAEVPPLRITQSHSVFYRVYALVVLVLVGICSWSDRQLFSILIQPIKHEFGLSDAQLGLLGGTAFGLFYVTVGLPIAWLADRADRRNVISGAIALWSLMTALSATATGYLSLFLCRMGVGVGEAGGAAPSQSLVSDYFTPRHRAVAMGVLYSYFPIGYFLSYALGGHLSDVADWRTVFVIFGIPGLLLAVLVRTTILEPRNSTERGSRNPAAPSFSSTLRYFFGRRSLRHIPWAGAAHGTGMFAAAVWMPAYVMRTYHLSAGEAGMRLALVMGVGGLVGTLAGGQIVDRLVTSTGNVRWYARACTVFLAASIPFTIAVFTTGNLTAAMLLFAVSMTLNHMILGPVVATVQNLAGATRRAMGAAFYLLLVNLISSVIGPPLTGALSDFFAARYGADSLRYSLLILMPTTCAWSALHFYLAGRSLPADLAEAKFTLEDGSSLGAAQLAAKRH